MKLLKFNLIFSLLLLLIVVFIAVSPAQADQITFDGLQLTFTATLSQSQVIGAQTFSLTVNATARSVGDLPPILSKVSKVLITGRIVAINNVTGVQVPAPLTANDYVITITTFPKKVGDPDFSTTPLVVKLEFPSGIESGSYNIVGQLMRVQPFIGPVPMPDITSLVPVNQQTQVIGLINYFATTPTPTPTSTPSPSNTPAPTPTLTPTPTATPSPTSTPTPTSTPSPTPVITGGSSEGGGGGGGGGGSSPVSVTPISSTPTVTPSPEPSPTPVQTPIVTLTPTPAPTSSGVNLSQSISSTGTVISKIKADSVDKKASVTIEPGVTGHDASGAPLKQISVTYVTHASNPPLAACLIGSYCDFGPNGTTFDRPVTITLQYDTASLNGVDQSSLYLGWWNTTTGNWVNLPSQVDP